MLIELKQLLFHFIYNEFKCSFLCAIANTGYQAPREQCRGGGAPRYIITERQPKFLIESGFKTSKIATILGVSKSVVKRRMR